MYAWISLTKVRPYLPQFLSLIKNANPKYQLGPNIK